MSKKQYTVKTLYLANFYEAAASMVQQRHNMTDTQKLIMAMKRLELADKTLEDELNRIAAQGYEMIDTFTHPSDEHKMDLVITAIFARDIKE